MTTIFTLPATIAPLKGQEASYMWEVGANVGMSGYLGDLNRGNMFSHPGFSAAAIGRYAIDTRWLLRVDAGYSTISGDVSAYKSEYPASVPLSFTSALGRLDFSAEFNFFAFGIGETYKQLSRWSPYIGAGIGLAVIAPHGATVTAAPELPLFVGFKYKATSRLNLSVEFMMSKMFTDSADGIKDIYGIKSRWIKNTDWLSCLTVGVSYEFGERCPACHYVE